MIAGKLKKIIILFLLIVFGSNPVQAQSKRRVSLLVSNYKASEKLGETQQIHKYTFVNGEYVSKELIASSKDIYFSTRLNQTYLNRYAISHNGDIVDILRKKLLHKSIGDLHRIEGNKVYIEVNRNNTNGLFVFDLTKQTYRLLRKNKFTGGELSPNGFRRVWANYKTLEINENEDGRSLGNNFDLEVEKDERSGERLKVCVFWLDDERILTQQGNGNIVIVDIYGKIMPVLKIANEPKCKGNPQIYKRNEKLIYRCSREYEIDIVKKTYKVAKSDLGFGFDKKDTDSFWYEYLSTGKEIGKIWSNESRTTKDYLAILYADDNANLGYPKGVKVWNNIKKDWITIEVNWGAKLIGWIEE